MSKEFRLLLFGATEDQLPEEVKILTSEIQCHDYDIEAMMEPFEPLPHVIMCYSPPEGFEVSNLEIAQTLRLVYENHSIFFVTNNQNDFDKKHLVKNGFTGAFIIPWEKADLVMAMQEEVLYTQIPQLRDYSPVKTVDILPDEALNFTLNIYLPLSNKILPLVREGEEIGEQKLAKLMEENQNTLYVDKDEGKKFKQYTSEVLTKKRGMSSETEKQAKLNNCVRELISDLFIQDSKENTFKNSQALLTELKDLIKTLLAKTGRSFSERISILMNQEYNYYKHLTNVSIYAGLFAKVIEIPNPEEVALAGLLHDIGKITLPHTVADRAMEELSSEELEEYKKHASKANDIIRAKKMVVPEKTMKAIEQHHEQMNGKGFPKALPADRIIVEAKVVAIANRFDHLTTKYEGKKSYTFVEALDQMIEENAKDPGRVILDVSLINKIRAMAEQL